MFSFKVFNFSSTTEKAQDIARYNFDEQRAISFLAFQHDKIIKPLGRTIADNIIGEGLKIHPAPIPSITGLSPEVAETLGRVMESRFKIWAEKYRFSSVQYSAYLSMKVLGDCPIFFIPDGDTVVPVPYDNFIIDSSMNDNGFFAGVRDDKFRRVEAIATRNEYGQSAKIIQAVKNGVRNFVMLRKVEVAGQVRGVPAFAIVARMARNFDSFLENEVRASKVKSTIVGGITSEASGEPGARLGGEKRDLRNIENPTAEDTEVYEVGEDGTSSFVHTKPGEKIDWFGTDRTAPDLAEFTKTLYEVASSIEGFPASMVMKRYDRSYSASRGEINEAEKIIRIERQRMKSEFLSPFFREWLEMEILSGRIDIPGYLGASEEVKQAFANIEITGPSREGLDALKDAKANEVLLNMGIASKASIAERHGYDYDYEFEKIREENKNSNEEKEEE